MADVNLTGSTTTTGSNMLYCYSCGATYPSGTYHLCTSPYGTVTNQQCPYCKVYYTGVHQCSYAPYTKDYTYAVATDASNVE